MCSSKLGLYLKGLYNKVDGLMIIKAFDVSCHPRKAPEIMAVVWYPPLPGWIKCNSDGLSKINGQAACGGAFRNCREDIAFFGDFFPVILAVEAAYSNSWRKIWFEMDSEAMLKTFFDPYFVAPWKICKRWEGCLRMLAQMEGCLTSSRKVTSLQVLSLMLL